MTEPTDFKSFEYKKIRVDGRTESWAKLLMDLVRVGWVREEDGECFRFLLWRMAPDVPENAGIDSVFVLTFSRPLKA